MLIFSGTSKNVKKRCSGCIPGKEKSKHKIEDGRMAAFALANCLELSLCLYILFRE